MTEPMTDVLDPRVLALITPWSAHQWSLALGRARADAVPESVLLDLVSKGAGPGLITQIPIVRKAFTQMNEAIARCSEVSAQSGDAISRFSTAASKPPTDVRERALWARQHRNTGPEHGHPWRM